MHLSLFSDFALRVLMYAALKDDLFQIEEVTDAYRISGHHLAKVVHSLSKLGYLETRRGRGGGIKLARPAEEIRLGKLLRETEKQPIFVECFDPATNTCVISQHCRLKGILAQAVNSFYAALDQYTLRDLVAGPHRERMRQSLLGAV
jgi:Rrf2 family transcriptional regulator, nitric oxide-sensitive transcriptional repressor